jgi:hypothetical protein
MTIGVLKPDIELERNLLEDMKINIVGVYYWVQL